MYNFTKFYVVFLICIYTLLFLGSSSSIKPINPDVKQNNQLVTEEPTDLSQQRKLTVNQETFYDIHKELEFPIIADPIRLSSFKSSEIIRLRSCVKLYRAYSGVLPSSLYSLIDIGFILAWPRNPMDGKPIEIITDRDLTAGKSDYGSLKYNVINDTKMAFEFISLDKTAYEKTGSEVYLKRIYEYDTEKPANVRKQIEVMGEKKSINEIMDPDKKLLFALCDDLNAMLFSNGILYYSYNEKTPESFLDIIFVKRLIIKENFDFFISLLKDTGAVYKWGFDRSKNTMYIVLEIDGERYIEICAKYGDIETSITNTGFHPGECQIGDLDMSSPILTETNISELQIPSEYLVSKELILAGD